MTSGKVQYIYIIYILCVDDDSGDKKTLNESRGCDSVQLGHRGGEEAMLYLGWGKKIESKKY